MPPEIPPNRFADHIASDEELDRAVDNNVEEIWGDVSDLSSDLHHSLLLNAIIEHSNGGLDQKYLGLQQATMLVNTNEELKQMLALAWKRKSYCEIRNLAILKAPQPKPQPTAPRIANTIPEPGLHEMLSRSFKATYRGVAVDGFYEYLTQNEKLFNTVENPRYYAKFCSIVQSSGTGKSRLLTELSKKDVVVIYMNLRERRDQLAFPKLDSVPSRILTNFPRTEEGYQFICYAFFIALFDTLKEYLSARHTTRNAKGGIMAWVNQMCDMSESSDPPRVTARDEFFRKLSQKYDRIEADVVSAHTATAGASSTSNLDQHADKLRRVSLSEANRKITARLFISYSRMATSLKRIFPDNPDQPKLLIALDEAHPLSKYGEVYCPANVFCRVVNQYSHYENRPVWVVFASTTSKVADFSPPNQKYNSNPVAVWGEKLFPPYTQLGWDQGASGLLKGNDIKKTSQIDHIAGYGRPLWLTLKDVLTLPKRVLDTASYKLCGADDFNPQKTNHVLAVLGQRFGLNIIFGHPDAVQHLETGVASHLRICLATTPDRNWRFTSYPSEPLLSCAAATALHRKPEKLQAALSTLLVEVNSGMIDMGQRGELASRLLWLLAKDLFIRTQAKNMVSEIPSTWEEHLADCQMIPVVDWLEFIFGSQIWGEEEAQTSLARKMFENAYLNFSHWVCMDANIAGSNEGNELGLEEWTQRHFQRTSAVQCCHQQPLIDKVIPIYFKGGPGTASVGSGMSQIFISDKARKSTNYKDVLRTITRRSIFLSGENGELPYITILVDLGQPASFSVTFPERDVDDRCLRIYAAGVNPTTYSFLARYPALGKTLQDLVHLQHMPQTERPYMEYLNAQVKFGSTVTAEHMHWEHRRSCP